MTSIPDEISTLVRDADVLFSAEEVAAAIAQLADRLCESLGESNPVVFSVMNGGLIFAGQLLTRLDFPLQVHYLHATRYGDALTGSQLAWKHKPDVNLQNRTVLILDDIFDEGHTLQAIAAWCQEQGAREVHSAVLLNKLHERKVQGYSPAFVGLDCPDRYVFGHGMDYKGYWRNAAGIYAIKGS